MKAWQHALGAAPRNIGAHRVCPGVLPATPIAKAVMHTFRFEVAVAAHARARPNFVFLIGQSLQIAAVPRGLNDERAARCYWISRWILHDIAALAHVADSIFSP